MKTVVYAHANVYWRIGAKRKSTKCLSRLSEDKAELVQALSSGSEIHEVNSIPMLTKRKTIRLYAQVA